MPALYVMPPAKANTSTTVFGSGELDNPWFLHGAYDRDPLAKIFDQNTDFGIVNIFVISSAQFLSSPEALIT